MPHLYVFPATNDGDFTGRVREHFLTPQCPGDIVVRMRTGMATPRS